MLHSWIKEVLKKSSNNVDGVITISLSKIRLIIRLPLYFWHLFWIISHWSVIKLNSDKLMTTMMSNIINEYVDNVYYKSSDFLLKVRICLRSFVFLFMNVIAIILLRIDFDASEDPIIRIYHKNRWLIITTWFNVSMKNNHNSLKKSLGTLMIIFFKHVFLWLI